VHFTRNFDVFYDNIFIGFQATIEIIQLHQMFSVPPN
jgi:hypothetical protein